MILYDDGYFEVFSVDNIDSLIFHMSDQEIKNALGIWFNFFDYMMVRTWDHQGKDNGISWNLKINSVLLGNYARKYNKELTITIGSDSIKMQIAPRYYFDKKMFCDTKFSIKVKRKEAAMLMHLYSHLFSEE